MIHSTKLLNKVLMVLVALLLLFNINYGAFKTSEAHANALTATFEEWAAASYATAVVATTTVAASAMHTEQYLKDNIDEMYQTAKETWPKMNADMKSNFLSSLDQMADGVIVAGDWVTAGLDALKAKFGASGDTLPKIPFYPGDDLTSFDLRDNPGITFRFKRDYVGGDNETISLGNTILQFKHAITQTGCGDAIVFEIYSGGLGGRLLYKSFTKGCGNDYDQGLPYLSQAQGVSSLVDLKAFIESVFGASVVLTLDGNVVNPGDNTYNKMDQWLRDVAIPAGNLGVYVPTDAIGWTPDGYRLGLSEDGQQLLKLPDGTPWDGDYSWRQPLLDTMDGVPAILDSAIGSWVDLHTGKKIRDATIPEMASATGVDESTAEYVLIRAKDEEKAREEDKDSGEYAGKPYEGDRNPDVDFRNGKGKSTLDRHADDHGNVSSEKYLQNARNFLDKPPTSTTQTFVSKEGTYFRYDTATNEFGIINKYGGISTYFKPEDKILYWLLQIEKYAPK